MLFEITNDEVLQPISETLKIGELFFEQLLSPDPGTILNEDVFGEELLFLGRQITLGNKRFDILAVDKLGRCVVIELKKKDAFLATGMQALDYIGVLRRFTGQQFYKSVLKNTEVEEAARNFLGNSIEINNSSRVILMAQEFNPTVFSLGRWLSEKGVAFKCIKFHPVSIEEKNLVGFSTVFSQSPIDEYAESLIAPERKPGKFWHILNYGPSNQEWWDYTRKEGIIALNYDNVPEESCPGYRKINEYINGDTIFVWANGYGLIGVGKIDGEYAFKKHGCKSLDGHYHQRPVDWNVTVDLKNAIPSQVVRELGFGNPRQAKQAIVQNYSKTNLLLESLRHHEAA